MVKPPWVQGHLTLTRAVLALVEDAGRRAYTRDEEACGYLSGPTSPELLVDRGLELENLANKYHRVDPEAHPRSGREYFKINALKFEKAIGEGAARGQPVKVFFHSHLDCGAYFSDEDAASMTMGGTESPAYDLCYLVTAVDQGQVTAHKLFVWSESNRAFVETDFAVV